MYTFCVQYECMQYDWSHDPLPLQDLETIIRASHQLQDSKVFKDVLEVGRSGNSLLVLGE